MTTIDLRDVTTPEEAKRRMNEALAPARAFADAALAATGGGVDHRPLDQINDTFRIVNRGRKQEAEGQSGLPRFNRYSIPQPHDPKAVDCPYCVKRPRNLRDHCRAVHPDKPEAR